MNRLLPIEGLRAYLAIWVFINHAFFFSSGAIESVPNGAFGKHLLLFLGNGSYAVQIFMIISGFVIFFLLDKKRESYAQFIVRRFFRLYPIYIALLLIAILSLPAEWHVFQHNARYMSQSSIDYFVQLEKTSQQHQPANILFHALMLQGITPVDWLGSMAVYSFIISAWSISVEWEFYLLAPLIYWLVMSERPLHRYLALGGALLAYFAIRHWQHLSPTFPLYIPFFFIGIFSYLAYKRLHALEPDITFPLAVCLAVVIFILGDKNTGLIPLVIWLPFFGLICESPASISSRLFSGLFNNPVAQFLGAISYGIYLCHQMNLMIAQYLLGKLLPNLGDAAHLVALLVLAFGGTVAMATLLHYSIEVPGMEIGKKLASAIRPKPLSSVSAQT